MNDSMREMMLCDAQKRSIGLAYVMWFFVGMLGSHRFYAGRKVSGAVQLCFTLVGVFGLFGGAGNIWAALFFVSALWVLLDAFALRGMVRDFNTRLAQRFARTVY